MTTQKKGQAPPRRKKQELPPALRANADKLKRGEPLEPAKRKRKPTGKKRG